VPARAVQKSDYIIHSLASERLHYAEQFQSSQPDVVVTHAWDHWGEWLLTHYWQFYKRLIEHYEVRAWTGVAAVWTHRAALSDPHELMKKTAAPTIPLRFADSTKAVGQGSWYLDQPPPDIAQLWSVKITYKTKFWPKMFRGLGLSPRYLVNIFGSHAQLPVSLPPEASTYEFPVIQRAHQKLRLMPSTVSLVPGAGLAAEKIEAVKVEASRRTVSELIRWMNGFQQHVSQN